MKRKIPKVTPNSDATVGDLFIVAKNFKARQVRDKEHLHVSKDSCLILTSIGENHIRGVTYREFSFLFGDVMICISGTWDQFDQYLVKS